MAETLPALAMASKSRNRLPSAADRAAAEATSLPLVDRVSARKTVSSVEVVISYPFSASRCSLAFHRGPEATGEYEGFLPRTFRASSSSHVAPSGPGKTPTAIPQRSILCRGWPFMEFLLNHGPDEIDAAIEHLDFAIAEFQGMKMQPECLERTLGRESG